MSVARPRVVVAEDPGLLEPGIRAAQLDRLARELPGWQVDDAEAVGRSAAYPWADVRALSCLTLPAVEPGRLTGLRYVQAVSTGVEHLPVAELAAAGVRVCNAAGTAAGEIAEFVLARILADAKRLAQARGAQAERTWRPVYGEGLRGAELLLVGFGAINRAVADLAGAFGMTVRVARRTPAGLLPPGVVEQRGLDALADLLAGARYVVCALPGVPDTAQLLDASAIDALADGALLVNVGRGSVLDETALAAACASGRIRAALDVVAVEPLPRSSPLWGTPGIAISAHCASVPGRALARAGDLFAANLRRLLDGVPLINQVAGPVGAVEELS
ncbi:D-2-hydroxyacid dehydrogenase [Nocardioides carbamazepini]|uniref:NAD(P)-dependent oxidoreductase n=1 Tax=Nocardioides carbamazepini TaxID=2854259 RepID=UPI002149BCBA|nr:NAD(P)-dependent oxidoreductase [Nocardioides carbamazepini]MCR1784330.1 D-2-hydroxyacid dehydrogenase [Nocardioides carbamazepini]